MAKMTFFYGTMKSGKSAQLIASVMNYWTKGEQVLVVKPMLDDRSGNKISTRLGMEIDCVLIPNEFGVLSRMLENAKDEGVKIAAVIIDEAQFLSSDIIVELSSIADDGTTVMAYGLKNDFKSELFEASKVLLELSDKIVEVKTLCQFCNHKAILNLRTVDGTPAPHDSPLVSIGDEEYYQVCRSHYFEFYGEKNKLKKVPNIKSLI